MEKNSAIILKTYMPARQKLCVLDHTLGKIMVVPNRTDISYATMITYSVQNAGARNACYFVHDIEIIDMPLQLAQEHILFIHHVLELCYYFIPLGSIAPQIFTLLLAWYKQPELFESSISKKIFLFQFFAALGLYPEGQQFQQSYFHQLARASIDTAARYHLDLKIEQELDAWLEQCINVHSCASYFKTIPFLHDNRA